MNGCILELSLIVTVNFLTPVHFPPSLKNYPFRGNGVYIIKGKVVEDFGFPSIEVGKMAKLPINQDPRRT